MDEPFFPQLALFVASPPLLALYREFIFPSVPSRTRLLPVALDEVHASHAENAHIAVDIALGKAAVVVYDTGSRGRLPLEYVRIRRGERPVIVVAAPVTEQARMHGEPTTSDQTALGRPHEMSGWPMDFVEPLLGRLAQVSVDPTPEQIQQRLARLTADEKWPDLLFTGLAMLERRMRRENPSSEIPVNATGGVMQLLENYFGDDSLTVVKAVSMRHDLLQNAAQIQPTDANDRTENERPRQIALAVANLARTKYGLETQPLQPS